MRKLSLFLIVMYTGLRAFSQDQNIPIAVMPFVSVLPEDKPRASQIQEMVVEILRNKSGIDIIDRSKDTLLVKELDLQIREQSMDANGLVQQGKISGATQMIVGTVSNVRVEENRKVYRDSKNNPVVSISYTANVSFSLQLSEVESGKIISQRAFNGKQGGGGLLSGFSLSNLIGGNDGTANTREAAIVEAIRANKKQILAWINETYPPEIKIVKIEDRNKKGFPQTILVAGIDGTVQKGDQIAINEIEMIDMGDGKKLRRLKKIVDLKIKEIQDEITICKVTRGEDVLEDKMKSGAKMELALKQ